MFCARILISEECRQVDNISCNKKINKKEIVKRYLKIFFLKKWPTSFVQDEKLYDQHGVSTFDLKPLQVDTKKIYMECC